MISWTRKTVLMQFIVFCFQDLCNHQLIYCQCFSAYVLLCLWFVDDRKHSVCLWACRQKLLDGVEQLNSTDIKYTDQKQLLQILLIYPLLAIHILIEWFILVENNFLNYFHWNTSVWLETWLFKCVFCAVGMLFAHTRSSLQASGLRKHTKTTLRFLFP